MQSSLLPFISKKETPQETTFNIDTPPRVGFYKLMIYAVRKPRRPGKLKIPLIATFLIDYRHRQDTSTSVRFFPMTCTITSLLPQKCTLDVRTLPPLPP